MRDLKNKVSFEVDDFKILQELSDSQLAIIEVYVCHDGNNRHNLPISLDVIKKAKDTLKNKFLVAALDEREDGGNGDFEGHELDEQIVGFFPESSKMEYREKDGRTYLVAQAIMSKVYAKWAYDVFVRDNHRSVSMEISVIESEISPEDGLEHILSFCFNGVTLLGKGHMPACEGAEASIIKFSCENASLEYSKHFESKSAKIKQDYVGRMEVAHSSNGSKFEEEIPIESDDTTLMEKKSIEIKNTKESAIHSNTWSNPGSKLYDPLLNATNSRALVKEAYLIVEDGYEDAPSEHLKYPHHTVKGGKLVINVAGLQAAFQRASQEGIISGDVKSHLLRHYRELGLSTENFETEGDDNDMEKEEIKETVAVESAEKMEDKTEREKIEKDNEKEALKKQKEDEKSDRDDLKETEEKKENSDEETEEAKMACDEIIDHEEYEALKEEVVVLRKKVADYEEEAKERAINSVLESVVEELSADDIAELRAKAANYELSNISEFENEVKARAYEAVKGKTKKAEFEKMPFDEGVKHTSKYSW